MEDSIQEDILDVRYVRLHFCLVMSEDCILPASKTSALRGGMGEMLLRANCIRDRKCDSCAFRQDCIVQHIMYSSFAIRPSFITGEESIGYVMECEDYQREFQAGDELWFSLTLFGKTILYLNLILQAFYALGETGLGTGMARFRIGAVTNTKNQPILDQGNIYMRYYEIETLRRYVSYRKRQIKEEPLQGQMAFRTPLSQKFQGEFLTEFNMEAIVRSVQRRIYMLDCFEGIDGEEAYKTPLPTPKILRQEVRPIKVMRYSARRDQTMPLRGIKGEIWLENVPEEILDILLAGEVTHIGKNTSFGFGRYKLL